MPRFRLIPHEEQFFVDFNRLSEHVRSGATLLRQMLSGDTINQDMVASIKDIEHLCDADTSAIMDRLNRTFVTPLDREDIHALASSLDDVMDAIDAAAAIIRLYRITEVRSGARRLAQIIAESADLMHNAVLALEKRQGVLELAARISQLEHEADRVHQDAIVSLFEDHKDDPITVMKWKEVLDFLEAATDRCEDVGNSLVGVVVKHG